MTPSAPEFDPDFRVRLRDLLVWRRDVRRFRTEPLAPGAVDALLAAACLAPSVGLSQPWRFVTVDDPGRRAAIAENFAIHNAEALAAYEGEARGAYARLKLAGLREAPSQVAAFADPDPAAGRGLGRRTMPETVEYSVLAAIHTLWLLARAEGIGMGWVSILDPAAVAAILEVPPAWRFIGYFCLGYPAEAADRPELERAGWEARRSPETAILRR